MLCLKYLCDVPIQNGNLKRVGYGYQRKIVMAVKTVCCWGISTLVFLFFSVRYEILKKVR